MRAQLLHLSGPYRGTTHTHPQTQVTLGTAADSTVRFAPGGSVTRRHAEIEFVEPECNFHLRAIDGPVFVNGRQIQEVILEPDDLFEVGIGGPKLRFRIHYEPGAVCKPVRQMLSDAVEVRGVSGLVAAGRSLKSDLLRHSSLIVKLVACVLIAALAFWSAYLGGAIGTKRTARSHEALRRQQREAITAELSAIHDQLRRQLEDFRREEAGHASRTELESLKADLARRAEVVDSLVARNDSLRRVLDDYSRGVCLVYGMYTFRLPTASEPVQVLASDGSPLQLEYFGSGFLVSSEGVVLTNRHVAEPWWNNGAVADLVEQGLIPIFVRLMAYFPNLRPTAIDPATVRVSAEGVDLAVLYVPPESVKGVPVLPLFAGDVRGFRGSRVILVGYPTGLNAVLARTEREVVDEILAAVNDTESLLAALSDRLLIAPVITQGSLNHVLDRRLIYDAETTSGGSGGPVFGPDGTVIGVNFAVTRDFGGSNFGVPIQYASTLLREP